MKNKLISTQFVEEEIVIDVKYINEGQEGMMLIDNGVPKSLVSSRWFDGYLQDAKVDEESVKRKSCARRFRMGKTVYLSKIEVTFPIVMKTENNDYIKKSVTENVIDSDEVNFLCGKATTKRWKIKVDMEEDKLEFKE